MNSQETTYLLKGKRFITTRPTGKSKQLKELLEKEGAQLLELPMIETKPIFSEVTLQAIQHLENFDWLLLTSANAVKYLTEAGASIPNFQEKLKRIQVAAIGAKTAEVIHSFGYTVDFVASKANSIDFVEEFKSIKAVANSNILWPTSNLSRNTIATELQDIANIEKVTLYDTIQSENRDKEIVDVIQNNAYELVYFFSPSAFESFYRQYKPGKNIRVASIGPVTSDFIRQKGLEPAFEASIQTEEGLFEATLNYLRIKSPH